MKKVYTSNYARNSENPNSYAISVYGPNWYKGKSFKLLAPKHQTVIDYKKGSITEAEYIKQYLEYITRDGQTAQTLYDAIPENAILLCYESPNEFCHRRVFAEWIKYELGIEIPELLNQKELEKIKHEKLVETILIFE